MGDPYTTENRYPALSAIAVFFKVIAALVAIVGVLMTVFAMKGGYDFTVSLGIIVAVLVTTVVIWAIAESIAVIIHIEANTRASAVAATRASEEQTKERLSSGANAGSWTTDPQRFLESLDYKVTRDGKKFVVRRQGEQSVSDAYSVKELADLAKSAALERGINFEET